jgi:arylformamidase
MKKYRIIDVSQWMDDFEFLGNPKLNLTGPFNRVPGSNPEFVYDFMSCTQSGTHIQGPHYFIKNGRRIDDFPLDCFEGKAAIVDLSKKGIDTTRHDLESLLKEVDPSTEVLIFRTGNMEEIINSKILDPTRRPGLSLDAAEYLAKNFSFKMLAIDSIGFESRQTKNFEINVYLCSQGLLLLEGLVNLYDVTSPDVFLEAFPLKIRGVEGTPCRAIIKEMIIER